MTRLATLHRRARSAWLTFAPAVLAANGDPKAEDAALMRPRVNAAWLLYRALTAEIDAEARRTRGEAMLEQRDAIDRITYALDWAA